MALETGRSSCDDEEAFLWASAALGEARRNRKLGAVALPEAVAFDLATGQSAPSPVTEPKRVAAKGARRRGATGESSVTKLRGLLPAPVAGPVQMMLLSRLGPRGEGRG